MSLHGFFNKSYWQPWTWHLFTSSRVVFLGTSFTNVGNDLHFLNLRWQNEQRSTIRQNKLNSLILSSIEHERLCEIDSINIINKFAMAKSRKCNLKQLVCCFSQAIGFDIDT